MRQPHFKNMAYYLHDHLIQLEKFDPKRLKLDKKQWMDLNIYYIGYVIKKPECNIYFVNPFYFLIKELNGFITEEKNSKYLNIVLTDNNDDVLMKYAEVWKRIK